MLNGSRYRFTGFNMPYQMWDGESLSYALSNWGAAQTVARIWAFQTYNIVSGAINWTKLDALLATFAAHGDRVILVLGNEWGGSGDAYGDGAQKYLPWWQGGYATQVQSTSVPPQVVTYREYVKEIVTRYASNPTIAMWQLVNEAEAMNADNSCTDASAEAALYAFATDVGGLIKSIDPNHLISLGNKGNSCGDWGTRYTYLASNPYLDVADYHDYNFPFNPMDDPDPNVGLQATLNYCAIDNKPLMVGETGIDWTASPPGGQTPIGPNTLAERATLFQAKVTTQFAAGVVGMLEWTWRNNPQTPFDSGDYGYEVGPGDPALGILGAF
jgi:mannan endo-1,4-beta-mannosidase